MSLTALVGFMVSHAPRSVTARTMDRAILRQANVYVNEVGMEQTATLPVDQTSMVSTAIRIALLVSTVRLASTGITFILVFIHISPVVAFLSFCSL